MSRESPLTFLDLCRVVQEWANDIGVHVAEVILVQRTGKQICLEVPIVPVGPASEEPQGTAEKRRRPKYSKQMLQAIYRILPAHDEPPITAKAIKNKSGYRDRSAIYAVLRRLRELGRLVQVDQKYRKAGRMQEGEPKRMARKMLKKLLSILPEPGQEPTLGKVAFKLSGYKSKSYVYCALRFLVSKGRVEQMDGKYRKARQQDGRS